MRTAFLITCATVLALSACQRQETSPDAETAPPQAVAGESPQAEVQRLAGPNAIVIDEASQAQQAPEAAMCDPARQGAVALRAMGAPGDTFQITLMCGGQMVAQCSAAAGPPGAPLARCSDGPNPEPAGAASCVVQPGNGNGPNARATWACAY